MKLTFGRKDDGSVIEQTVEAQVVSYNRMGQLATLPSNQEPSQAEP